jgi:hypothetical protein
MSNTHQKYPPILKKHPGTKSKSVKFDMSVIDESISINDKTHKIKKANKTSSSSSISDPDLLYDEYEPHNLQNPLPFIDNIRKLNQINNVDDVDDVDDLNEDDNLNENDNETIESDDYVSDSEFDIKLPDVSYDKKLLESQKMIKDLYNLFLETYPNFKTSNEKNKQIIMDLCIVVVNMIPIEIANSNTKGNLNYYLNFMKSSINEIITTNSGNYMDDTEICNTSEINDLEIIDELLKKSLK